jgi:hypothetical protein
VPGFEKICAETGPVAEFFELELARLPAPQTPLPASPKPHLNSSSWNGFEVAVAVVEVASKKTERGATPVSLLGLIAGVIAAKDPVTASLLQTTVGATGEPAEPALSPPPPLSKHPAKEDPKINTTKNR